MSAASVFVAEGAACCTSCGLAYEDCDCPDDGDDAQGFAELDAEEREREGHRAEERRAFGNKCRLVMALLRVHGQPCSFEAAKLWVKLYEGSADPSEDVAKWLDAGFYDPEDPDIETAARMGATPDDLRAGRAARRKLGPDADFEMAEFLDPLVRGRA